MDNSDTSRNENGKRDEPTGRSEELPRNAALPAGEPASEPVMVLPREPVQEPIASEPTIEALPVAIHMEENQPMVEKTAMPGDESTGSNGGIEPVAASDSSGIALAPKDAFPNPMIARAAPVQNFIAALLAKANATLRFRKKKKLEKILALATAKHTITNNDVERNLRVSDATASRYLRELVKSGKLQMVGNVHQPRYTLV